MDKEAYEELRFKAACAAMQSLLVTQYLSGKEIVVSASVNMADALLKELGYTDKPKDNMWTSDGKMPQDNKALPFSFMQGPGRPGM